MYILSLYPGQTQDKNRCRTTADWGLADVDKLVRPWLRTLLVRLCDCAIRPQDWRPKRRYPCPGPGNLLPWTCRLPAVPCFACHPMRQTRGLTTGDCVTETGEKEDRSGSARLVPPRTCALSTRRAICRHSPTSSHKEGPFSCHGMLSSCLAACRAFCHSWASPLGDLRTGTNSEGITMAGIELE